MKWEERKSPNKRISIDWTPYSQRYCHNICVRAVKRVDFNILGAKGLIPLRGGPHGVVFAKTILQHFLSPSTKFLAYDYIMRDSNTGHYTHSFCGMECVNFGTSWYNYWIPDWQRVYKGCVIEPKINMWCMNFYRKARYGEV